MAIQKFSDYRKQQEEQVKTNQIQKFSDYAKENNINYTVNKILPTKNSTGNKIGATLGNLGLLLGKGIVDSSEGILDFLNDWTGKTTSKAFELIGRDDLAQKETENRRNFIQRDLTQELGNVTGASEKITENEQNGSLLTRNNLGGQIVQAVGGQVPTLLIGGAIGAGGLNTAINASNMGFWGKVGTTALVNAPTNTILASKSYGGALEEAYLNGATEEEATKYAIGSTAVEIASEWVTGGIPGTGGKGGIDVFADKGIDKISNKLVKDLVRYGYKMVGEGVEEGLAEILSPILKNATYSSGEKINWQDVLNSAIVGGISAGIIEAPSTVSNISNDIRQNKNNTKLPTVNDIVNQEQTTNFNSNQVNLPIVNDIVKNSINTNETTNQSLTVKKLDFIESARKYNIDTNNDTIRSINKTLSQRNINASWDDKVFKSSKQNAIWKLNSDGTREIVFNPKAETGDLLQNVAIHELYHDLTTSQNGNAIKSEILEFAKTKEGYQEARLDLEKTYSEIYDKNSAEFQQLVDEEVVASILGNKLGDQQFVSQVTIQKPSLARQIYNWVVDKLNTLNKSIGYKSERLFWEDIKNKFENAYREEFNSSQSINSIEKYSTIGLKGAKNLEKNSKSDYYRNLYQNQKNASEIFNRSSEDLETTNIQTKKETGWFKTKYGDWGTLVSDKNSKLTQKLEPNHTYRLGKILEHDLLYKAYPELKKLKVKTSDINTTGGYAKYKILPANIYTDEINLRNSDLYKKDFRKTLLHEINHYIQSKESYNKNSRGSNSFNKETYRNNLGEIMSNETKINADLTQIELNDIILPEQAKHKPKYENIKQKLLESNKKDLTGGDASATQTGKNILQNEFENSSLVNNKSDNNSRIKKYYNDEGLDNSSFSINENSNWQEHLNKNYSSTGKGKTLQDVKLPLPKDPTKAESYEEPEKLANILEERPVTPQEKDNWLKKLITIKVLDKGYYVDKLARQTQNKELSSKYDYMLMANGVAQQIIGNERFNPKTQQSQGKGLHKIFEPIENSGKLQEFSEYIYHKHNISRMNLSTLFQEDNKPIFGDSVTSETSQSIVENYENTNPEFIEWAQEIYDYNNFLLDVLVDYGVISSEDKAYYNKKYPYYVPTIRATDKTKTQMDFLGKKASVNTPIKKAKGGNQDIIPLKEAMALRTMQTMNSALRNNFGNELLNTIETQAESNKVNIDDIVGDDIDVDEFITKSTNKNPATLTIFKNGQKITFDIADEIYEALAPSQRYKFKTLNTISKIRRALITEYNPVFMLTNPQKDIQDGALNSKHPALFVKNLAEATKQITTKGEFYKLYLSNGGGYETYFNYGEGYNKIPVKRSTLDPRRILDKISQVNQSIEMTPRLAEFISSLEAGDSIETAMYNAQEITTNFKRGGNWTKNLDANGMTFLNAGVQGTVKQIRNIQEAKSQGIKGMTNLAVKWSIAGLTPYILSQLIWGNDDEYEELSDYVKNNYYILWKNDGGEFIRIPKGRVVSVIQNLFKQPLDALKGEKIDVNEFVDLLQNQVLPSDPTESNILSPLLDVAQNKTWYGGDLVPQRLQSLPAEEQYDESTDSISIWLGQKLGISPIKINYILDQYSGAIGDMILPSLTLEAENDSNSFMSNLLSPVKSKFTTDSTMNNQNISDLYDLDDELTKKSKSSNATTEDILKSKYINSIQTEMNKLTAEKRNIQNDKTLTNNEKYKQVKEIQKQINKLAKEGLNNYENVVGLSNYGKVAGVEYYLNSKEQWTKVTDEEIESLNELSMTDDDKNKYFTTKAKIGVIRSDENKESNIKHLEIANLVINSNLSDEYKGFLYSKYYSSEKVIDSVLNANIDIDEFIKFNSQEFTTDYYENGKAITNSRKNKVIKYVNSLNLSIPQKAILIKMEYSSYDNYNSQIVNYINKMNYSKFEKASLLKSFGFDNYDKYLVSYINNMNLSKEEKTDMLEELGFTIRDGKVYY